MLSKFNKNRREKDKKVERERRGISATLLPKFLCPNSCPFCACVLKKSNCGNAIAEIEKKKRNFFLVIVAMALPKMEKKKLNGIMAMSLPKMGEKKNLLPKSGKKFQKKCYVHNIFIILSQQITGD